MRVLFSRSHEEHYAMVLVRVLHRPTAFCECESHRYVLRQRWASVKLGRIVLTEDGERWARLFEAVGVKEGEA